MASEVRVLNHVLQLLQKEVNEVLKQEGGEDWAELCPPGRQLVGWPLAGELLAPWAAGMAFLVCRVR